MKTLLLSVALFLFLSYPSHSFSQGSEVSSVLTGLIGDSTIDLPESFECNKSITIQLLTESNDSLRKGLNYILRYPEHGNYMIMMPANNSDSDMKRKSEMVIDFEKMQMITFLYSAGAKMAVVMPVEASQIADMTTLSQKYGALIKTGKSKIISGHKAEEFRFNSETETGTLWIGQDFNLNITKSFAALGLEIHSPEVKSKGIIVELESVDKSTGKHTKMSLLDVNLKDQYTINTSGYIPTKLPEALGE